MASAATLRVSPDAYARASAMAEFDRYTAGYEELVERSFAFSGRGHSFFLQAKATRLFELVRRRLGDPSGVRALDVGCGDGAFDAYLSAFGKLEGVDVSEQMIARAQEANPDASYRVADGTRLPFDDAAFDLVFTVCVLHHVPVADRERFAKELRRVTRSGGLVVVFEHNPWNPLTRLAVHRCEFDEDAVLLTQREVSRRLARAGLRPLEHGYLLFVPWRAPRLERALVRVPLGAQHYVAAGP